jgi:hypothetical protein
MVHCPQILITAQHLILPEALSKHGKKWVILAFLKRLGGKLCVVAQVIRKAFNPKPQALSLKNTWQNQDKTPHKPHDPNSKP